MWNLEPPSFIGWATPENTSFFASKELVKFGTRKDLVFLVIPAHTHSKKKTSVDFVLSLLVEMEANIH